MTDHAETGRLWSMVINSPLNVEMTDHTEDIQVVREALDWDVGRPIPGWNKAHQALDRIEAREARLRELVLAYVNKGARWFYLAQEHDLGTLKVEMDAASELLKFILTEEAINDRVGLDRH